MRFRASSLLRTGATAFLLTCLSQSAFAQQLDENCTVSVLNRNVRANADGSWVLPNVPANFGYVRARATCIINGQTVSGESEPFLLSPNGVVNIPRIIFGSTTPIPTSVVIAAPTQILDLVGATAQLTVTATYVGGTTTDVTAAATGTQYTDSNSAIATISGNGLVQAVRAGTVLIQATHEGRSGMISIQVSPGGVDSDGDGIPDDAEVGLGLDPHNAVDAQEDFDRDGLTNIQEYQSGTDIRKADTDSDGLTDGQEVVRGTSPLLRDTDGDGLGDGLEVQTGSNPLDASSYNLQAALSSITVTPSPFVLTFNTILGDVTRQLRVTGALIDGTTINLTSKQRGTNYSSSNLNVCNFGATDGLVFAGEQGNCSITVTLAGFMAVALGEVHRFAPTPLSSLDLGGSGDSVDVSGGFAYVAVSGVGLKVVDVTNRNAPFIVATLNLPGTANDVKLAGPFAYVAAGGAGLHIVDVSNPLSPQLLGTFDTSGDAQDVRVYGNLAFVADGPSGLQIVDVATPAAPRPVGSLGNIGTARGVDVADGLAVVANGTGLRLLDVSTPSHPTSITSLNLPGDAQDVVVRGTIAYVADYTGSLQVVNIGTPTAPVVVGTTPTLTGGIISDVAVSGNFAFGADVFFVNGVPIVDVTTPSNPIPRAILTFPGDSTGLGVAADGSYIYLVGSDGRLYIGQYRLLEDLEGIPPTVTIVSPAPGATFIEGETIPVIVNATDDVTVVATTVTVDGVQGATDTAAPYQFTTPALVGANVVTLGALAIDLGGNVGVAADLQVNVIPDPLTTVVGRVIDSNGVPVAGAAVACLAESTVSAADGSFSLPGVRTIQPLIFCTADFLTPQGVPLHGISARVAPVRAGTTEVGDLRLLAVPVITSIRPRVIDSFSAPNTLRITGANLTGTTFAFVSDGTPIVTTGTPQIDAAGTSATLPISVVFGSQGTLVLAATNAIGSSETFSTAGNTLVVVNLPPTGDVDADGLTNEYELLIGADPALADTDLDGLPDGWEIRYGLNPLVNDATLDADSDGSTNAQELSAGTDPRNSHTVPPIVVQTFPADGATDYPTNGVFIARFAEPLQAGLALSVARTAIDDAAPPPLLSPVDLSSAAQTLQTYMRGHGEGDTVVPGTVRLFRQDTEIPGSVSLSNDRLSVTFTPSQVLATETTYTTTVQGLRDAAGVLMTQAFHSSFTTGVTSDNTPPHIVVTNPTGGASGVPVNAVVTLQFSKRIDPATLTPQNVPVYDGTTGQPVAGMLQVEPNGLFASFVPAAPWSVGRTFSVYPSQDIKDTGGNRLSYYAFSFSTGFGADTDGPSVTGTSPPDGTPNVPLNVPVQVQFSEPLDAITASVGVQLFDNGIEVAGSIALSDGNRRITFTPAAPLSPNTTFTIAPSAEVTDIAGNLVTATPTAAFTTGTESDFQGPSVTWHSPSGAADVPTNAVMTFSFSERVNPLSVNSQSLWVYPQATAVPIAGSIVVSADGRSVTLRPASPLAPSTSYTMYAYGITDLVGYATYNSADFTTGPGPQTSGPTVAALSPPDGSADVPLNARVIARMSTPISPLSVGPSAITVANGVPVEGAVTMSGDRTVVFTPAAQLAAATAYSVTVDGLADLAGNVGPPSISTFTTGATALTTNPSVTSVTPGYGATDVPVDTAIQVTFSAPVDPTSVGVGTITLWTSANLAATYQVNGSVVTITPTGPLPGNADINLQVYGVQDLAGNSNDYYYEWFRTEATIDTTPPTVLGITPSNGATGVGLNALAVITFSESLNSSTVNNDTLALFANGGRIGYVSGISQDNRTVSLSGGMLPANSEVTVVATTGVQDVSGNALADFTSAFTTASGFDVSHPSVVSQRPGNGAYGVGLNIPLVFFLNERIDPASIAGALHVSQNGELVAGNLQMTGNGQVLTFRPASPWTPSALVQVFLDGSARDLNGNSLNGYQSSFRTAEDPLTAVPTVTSTSPTYGSNGNPLNVIVSLGFNVALDAASVNGTTVVLSGPNGVENAALSLDATGRVIRITPPAALVANSFYTFQTLPGLRSVDGVTQPNSGWWYFYTGSTSDTVAPTVLSVTPPHGAVNVGDNAGIIVRFSEPIDPLTVNATTLAVASPLGAIDYSVGFGNGTRDVYLTPYAPLPDGQVVTVTLLGVTDLGGNAAAPSATQFAVTDGPDLVPPMAIATNPANGLVNVPTNVVIAVRTNEPIDPSTVTSSTFPVYDNFVGQQVPGTYSVSSDSRTISFAPSAPLGVGRSHSVYFSGYGMTDLSGNLIGPAGGLSNFSFSTGYAAAGAGPQIVGVSPADQLVGVPRNTQVVIDFDRSIDVLSASLISLSAGGQTVPTIMAFGNGDARVVLTPVSPLAPGTLYTLTIGAVTDLSGLPATAVTQHFTTATGVDLIPPVVTVTSPVNGAVDVPTNALIQVGFSERMDQTTVHGSTFVVYPQATGIPINGSYLVASDGRSATMIPAGPLAPFTAYTAYASGITDLTGQGVYYSWTFTTGAGPRTSGPMVVAFSPPDGSADVPLNAQIAAYVDAALNPLTIGPGSLSVHSAGTPVGGTVSLSNDRRALMFAPSAPLTATATYTVDVANAADLAGNAVMPATSTFSTGTTTATANQLSVIAVVPPQGTLDVPVTTPIQVTFSAAINPASVGLNTMTLWTSANLAATYQVSGNVATITPTGPLPGNTQINLQVYGVQDLAGNANNYYYEWFWTAAVFDTTAPTVIGVTPVDGTTDVGLNAPIAVTFSESLNPGTVNNNTVGLIANGTRFGYFAGISSDNRTVFLSGGALPARSVVTIVLTSDIQDVSGNALADFSSAFTTNSAFDTSRPSVVGQRPGNGASGVAAMTPIVLFLNEPLDPSTLSALKVSQNGQLVPGTVQSSANAQTLLFQPDNPWSPSALIQIFLDGSAQDVNGNAVNPYQGSFRTATDPLTTPPTPTGTTPTYGQDNVPLNAVITLGFNVPLDPASVNGTTVQLSGPWGSGLQSAALSLDATGQVIRIIPPAPLEPNVYYYAWTNPGIRSATGVAQQTMAWWYFYTGSTSDTVAPTVRSVTPPHGAVNVGDNARIIVRFSEPINPQTVNAFTVAVNGPLAGVFSSIGFGNGNHDVYVTPLAPLPDGQVVTVTVSDVADQSGNAVTPSSTQFVVGNGPDVVGPAVVATNPASGLGNTPPNVVIALRVNEPIDPGSVTSSTFPVYDNFVGQQVPGTYTVSSDSQTIRFAPDAPLAVNRGHSVYFHSYGMADLAGNQLGSAGGLGNYGFTTGSALNVTGPQVVGVSPPDQLTNVPRNTQVVIDFDRAIDTLTADQVTLAAGGQTVALIVGFGNGDARIVLTPIVPLLPSTTYTLTIGAVRDVSGLPLATPQVLHFTTASGVDLIAPVVTVTNPPNGAVNVPTNALIQVGFSERMDPRTVNAGTFVVYPQSTGIPINASYLVAADGRSATLVPAAPLLPLTGYYAYASGITDLVGQREDYAWSFTTGAGPQTSAPVVLTVSPPAGTSGVAVNAKVSILVSVPISPVTLPTDAIALLASGIPVAGSLLLSGDRQTVTFTPSVDLAPSTTYTVTAGNFTDMAGNVVIPFGSTFTTGIGAADSGPLVVNAITPAHGAQDVAVNTTIVATFNKAINPLSVTSSSFQVYYPGVSSVAGSYTINGASVSFAPSSPLPGDTTVNVQINGVQDLSGIGNDYVNISFRTAAVADTDPPTVVNVTPNDGSVDVGLNSTVVVMFSESVNPATINNDTFALFANGSRFGYISSMSADSRTVTLYGGTLPASSVVTVVVTGDVQDLASNALADFTASFTTTAGIDASRPSVVGQRPGNGANDVTPGTPIVLFLNERMNAATVPGAVQVTENGALVAGTVQMAGGDQVVHFTPATPWTFNALIQAFLDSGATDLNGNSVNAYQASFRTAADPASTSPAVTATSPVNGSGDAPLNPVITLGFSVPLDPSTVDAASVILSGPAGVVNAAVGLDATSRVVRIVPAAELAPGSFYSYQTTAAIRGANGLAQQNPGSWYFYTGTAADAVAPSVRSVTPPHGAINIGDNAAIMVRFSEPINPMTVNGATIAISGPVGAIETSIGFSNQNRNVSLTPYAPLPDGQVVTVTIAGVTDLSGNGAEPTVTQFVVGAGPDLTPPVVTATNPVNGLGNVPTNVVIALRTNEPIDPASVTSDTLLVYDNSLGQVAGNVVVSGDGRTINFVPVALLAVNRTHSVYFSWYGMTDLAGNLLGPGGGLSNFSFTTGATADVGGPQVLAFSPSDLLTSVPRNVQVMVDFDRAIDALSVDQITLSWGGQPVALSTSLTSGDARAILTPLVPLQAGTIYTITIGAVTDLSGLPLETPVTSQFTTGSSVDLIAPFVTSVTPANETQNVALNATVQLTFSERINRLSVNPVTLWLIDGTTGQRVPGDIIVSGDGLNAAFIPIAPLTAATTYYVQTSGFADLAGQQGSMFTSFRTTP